MVIHIFVLMLLLLQNTFSATSPVALTNASTPPGASQPLNGIVTTNGVTEPSILKEMVVVSKSPDFFTYAFTAITILVSILTVSK